VWDVDEVSPGQQTGKLTGATVARDPSDVPLKKTPRQMFRIPAILGVAEAVLPIDKSSILTMNNNGVFKWDLDTMQLVKSYRAHAELTEARFSADGLFVVTGSRSVKIWDAQSGEALDKLESPHIGPVRSVQFSPTSYVFATGGDDGVARTWRWDHENRQIVPLKEYVADLAADDGNDSDRREIISLRRHLSDVTAVDIAERGKLLMTAGRDGAVILWPADPPPNPADRIEANREEN
jgi:WD40 repeat protein